MVPNYIVRIFGKTKAGQDYNGTGFLVNSNGDVATCWHVVREADYIYVKLPYTQKWRYDVFEYREREDVAILKLHVPPMHETAYATLHPDWFERNKIGREVDLYGYSNADNNADSALRLKCTISGMSNEYGLIMLVGAVNPGDSGGPILNSDGDVIGMANFKDTERDGQAMARPISRLCKLLTEKELTFGAKVGSGKLAGRAITSFNDVMNDHRVRDAFVDEYGSIVKESSQRISTLHAYKEVHDLLYYVEVGYNSMVFDALDFPHHPLARVKMKMHLDNLRRHVTNAEEIASEVDECRDRIDRVRYQLKEAYAALNDANLHSSVSSYNNALYLLQNLMVRAQSNFNSLINQVAGHLKLNRLTEAMQQTISGIDLPPNVMENLQLGIYDLAQLETELHRRTTEHDKWQQLDDTLRSFNRNSPNLLSEIEAFWRILISDVAKAIDPPEARGAAKDDKRSDWVDYIIPESTTDPIALILRDLKKALKQRDLTSARNHLESLFQYTTERLDAVDKKLRRVCEKITEVKDPLRTLVENLR